MKRSKLFSRTAACGCALALIVACSPRRMINNSVDRFVSSTVDATAKRAGEEVGKEVGKAIAGHLLAHLTPAMLHSYAVGVFQLLFSHGGYGAYSFAPYEPGEFTRWQADGRKEASRFERTLLRREADGKEWWRVEAWGEDADGDAQQVIMEALLSAPEATGTRHVRRMRAKLPGDEAAQEIPITEDNAHLWVVRIEQKLTAESLEGMRVGEDDVTVPAGAFRAEHLKGGQAGGSELHWWIVREGVPGSVVKFERVSAHEDADSAVRYRVELDAHGKDATASKLGVFDAAELK